MLTEDKLLADVPGTKRRERPCWSRDCFVVDIVSGQYGEDDSYS